MIFLYNLSIRLYSFLVLCASPFNRKAAQWLNGRKGLFQKLAMAMKENTNPVIWFHAASLGEFEQGRPIIETLKQKEPDYKILLTFFSPSGYEVRKNYAHADWIFYLPLDTKSNAKKFIQLVNPKKAVFIKYEFWLHYFQTLHKSNIPTFIISAIFRENQLFFKWYGKWYKKILLNLDHLFVQNTASLNLLKEHSINNATLSGDTRFDRVYKIAQKPEKLTAIGQSINSKKLTIVAGSSWPKEEEFLSRFYKQYPDINLIIAPHEIHESNLRRIEQLFEKNITRYRALQNGKNDSVILIDTIGILSSVYQFGDIAIIGGGFGKGIHNILEAATFGLPVLFGPNHQKFAEALELTGLEAAFSFANYQQFETVLKQLINNKEMLKKVSTIARNYVHNNTGATTKIVKHLTFS